MRICAMAVVVLAMTAGVARAEELPEGEKQKIEKLISFVENMQDVKFVRKGTEYDCKAAAKFMRGKWEWKKDEVKSAADFVKICSGGGSGEGAPYLIRHKDGKDEKAGVVLGAELKRIETETASK